MAQQISPMRILTLCHEFPPIGGGAAAVTAALARKLTELGHELVVVTMGMDNLPETEDVAGCTVHRVACGRRRKEMASAREGLRWAARSAPLVQRMCRSDRFDLAHAHFIMPAGIVAHRLQRETGVPFLITAHGSDVPGYNRERLKLAHVLARPWWQRIGRSAGRIVCPSRSLLSLLEAKLTGARTQVIPNGFEPGRFMPLEKEQRILLCSRLVERKGFHHFLSGIRDVELPGWEIDLVGDGPMYPRLAELASACRMPVRMHGWIDNDDPRLAELHGRAMIYVFPSEWENFPIALLEAMSAGCAVVSTDISGNPEAVGDCGVLVPPKDPAALRKAVLELTKDQDRCVELGELAALRAELFSWDKIAARYLEAYREVAASRDEVSLSLTK